MNWNLNTKCSLVLCPRHRLFFQWVVTLCSRYNQHILNWFKNVQRIINADRDIVKTNQLLKSTGLKVETEGLIIAAYNQILPTRNYPANIITNGSNLICTLCEVKIETTDHLIYSCLILTPRECKESHDKIEHWKTCKYCTISNGEKWYKHQPEPLTEAKRATILWDFAIQTGRKIKINRPDIVFKDY